MNEIQKILLRFDAEMGGELSRVDADLIPFFSRQLESIASRVYEADQPDLIGANGELLPMASDVAPGSETFIWYTYEAKGVAEFVSAYAAGEVPEVTISGAENIGRIHVSRMAYSWSFDDVKRAQKAGVPLNDRMARQARRGQDERLHRTVLWGRQDLGLPGLINHVNIQVTVAADNGSSSTLWADKTVEQIVEDLGSIIHGTEELTNDVIRISDVRISTRVYNSISRRRLGAGDGSRTILEHIQKVFSGVKFNPMRELQSDKSLGNLTADAAFAYAKGSQYADAVRPVGFTQLPVQREGYTFKVYTYQEIGGVRMPQPLAHHRLDDIG